MTPAGPSDIPLPPAGAAEPTGHPGAAAGPVPPPPPPPPRRRGLWIGLTAAAAAAAVTVGAVVLFTGDDRPPRPAAANTSPTPSATPTIPVPLGLHADATAVPLSVSLGWVAPPGAIVGYRIYRNGKQVGTVPVPETSFTDNDVRPNRTYTYEVLARGEGLLQSERTSVAVKVPVPPLSAARVEGVFNVKIHPTSQSGFTKSFEDYTTGWSFDPRCETGACKVLWKWSVYKGIKDTLHREGARYDGSDTGKLNVKCGGTIVQSTVTIEFKVVKAKAVAGSWNATKLTGTMKQTSSSQLGCVASSLTADVAATLLS